MLIMIVPGKSSGSFSSPMLAIITEMGRGSFMPFRMISACCIIRLYSSVPGAGGFEDSKWTGESRLITNAMKLSPTWTHTYGSNEPSYSRFDVILSKAEFTGMHSSMFVATGRTL